MLHPLPTLISISKSFWRTYTFKIFITFFKNSGTRTLDSVVLHFKMRILTYWFYLNVHKTYWKLVSLDCFHNIKIALEMETFQEQRVYNIGTLQDAYFMAYQFFYYACYGPQAGFTLTNKSERLKILILLLF